MYDDALLHKATEQGRQAAIDFRAIPLATRVHVGPPLNPYPEVCPRERLAWLNGWNSWGKPHLRLHYRFSLRLQRHVWFVSGDEWTTGYQDTSGGALQAAGEYRERTEPRKRESMTISLADCL